MPYKQIATVPEEQTRRFDSISQAKDPSVIDRILMILDSVFGCWHRDRSRPFTLSGWTYEVCLDCGRKFTYDRAAIVCSIPQTREILLLNE
jgi:hypothetical protein